MGRSGVSRPSCFETRSIPRKDVEPKCWDPFHSSPDPFPNANTPFPYLLTWFWGREGGLDSGLFVSSDQRKAPNRCPATFRLHLEILFFEKLGPDPSCCLSRVFVCCILPIECSGQISSFGLSRVDRTPSFSLVARHYYVLLASRAPEARKKAAGKGIDHLKLVFVLWSRK